MRGRQRSADGSALRAEGFTLVEVLIVMGIIPLILGAAFGAVSVVLRAYRSIDTRADLLSAGMLVMETLGQDLRGAQQVYSDSCSSRLHVRLQDGETKVVYEFTPPDGSSKGFITRNGKDLLGPTTSVASCEFGYLTAASDPESPLPEVPPENASSVRIRLSISRNSATITLESVFDLRNL